MEELLFNVALLTPASDLITGSSGVDVDVIFGRAGNDIFYSYDPLTDFDDEFNIDILVGDLFDNSPEEFAVTLEIQAGNTFAIQDADIQSVGQDRFVLGDEFQVYYTSSNPLDLLDSNLFGFNEFAVLYDFDPNEDIVQLSGDKDDYSLVPLNAVPIEDTLFSGFGIFSLQTGVADLVALIVGDPTEELELDDKDVFQFVKQKPEDKPKEKEIGQFGTAGLDFSYGAAVAGDGSLYVTGTTSGSLNGVNQGSSDVWVTRYDASGNQTLVEQFGSTDGDVAYEVVTDRDGNFYLAGSTSGSLYGAKNSSNGSDAWVAKYNSGGELLWGRQLGEDSIEGDFGFSTSGFGLQVDDGGNVYLSGLTINDNNPANGGKGILDFSVEDDSWVAKFDRDGNQQWFTKIVDPQQPEVSPLAVTPFFDESYDLAVDDDGNSYLVGWTQGLTKESDPSRLLLKYDAWVSKVDSSGNVVWTEQFGSVDEGLEFAWGTDVDSQGNVYVAGWTTGELGVRDEDFEDSDSYDIFLTKFNPDGEQIWAKQIGTTEDDGSYFGDLVIDNNDNIFVSGYTNGKLGKDGSGKDTDGWVGRFDTNGNNEWIQQLGLKDKADYATGLAVSEFGQLYVTGFTEGFFGESNNFQAQGASIDAWVAELDIEKGKIVEFSGNSGENLSAGSPSAFATVDISNQLVTSEDLPDGDNIIQTIEDESIGVEVVDYGVIASNLGSTFDPENPNSLSAALSEYLTNNSDLLPSSVGEEETKGYKAKGGDKGDFLIGRSGDDEMKGEDGDDVLYGYAGDDKLEGKDDNDSLYGGLGNDELTGGKGDDLLVGVDDSVGFGKGEIDTMKGDKGADLYVLGDRNRVYYDDDVTTSLGLDDYALIEKFEFKEQDKIQLHGSAWDYTLGSSPVDEKGTAIFHTGGQNAEQGELIAIIEDVKEKEISLYDMDVFSYV